MGTHRELSKRSLRAKKRPVRAKNGQLERKKGQSERKNGQVERKSAFEVPSGLPKNFKSARTRQLRASKSVMRAAKGRRSPKPPRPFSVISRWILKFGKNHGLWEIASLNKVPPSLPISVQSSLIPPPFNA